jgi:uracil-DNA glycosylase family 4
MTRTPWQQFQEKWGSCTACSLHESRSHIVLARGTIPADLLFLGEAPGSAEDVLGRPFCGVSGQLLDHIIRRSVPESFRCAFTNLVCCIPVTEEGEKMGEPEDRCVRACSPRLQEFVRLVEPRLIVCVGRLAEDWLDEGYRHAIRLHRKIPRVSLKHPAAILRGHVAQRGLDIQRCEVTLRNVARDLLEKF